MTDREKLIELIRKAKQAFDIDRFNCDAYGFMADHLIANGVTVQKWIPVTESLPSEKKVIDGETYFKNVAVRVKDLAFEKIAFYDDDVKCWFDTDFFPVDGDVTHWMPLPEPPRSTTD